MIGGAAGRYYMIKKILDFIFSLIVFILLSPVCLLISIVILSTSGSPIFYRGKRTGVDNESFMMLKFRTMIKNAEAIGGPSTALNDTRLTKVGKFLRKYKLDELPQLINVIKGDMSFVGPRPQVEKYTVLYNEEERKILSVKPGITDFASIELIHLDSILGCSNVDEKYLSEIEPLKNRLRLKYVYEQSMWTDIKIIFLTAIQLFKINNLWNTKK